MLTKLTINEFLDKLGSDEPAPGGGSASALGGAMGADLLAMVCALTKGKKGYEEVWDECKAAFDETKAASKRLRELIDEDTAAFNEWMTAIAMPKKTPEAKAARLEAIQVAIKKATEKPFEIATVARQMLTRAPRLAEVGNKNAISDIGVGSLLLTTAVNGGLLNVEINLGGIKDDRFVAKMKAGMENLRQGMATDLNAAMRTVHANL